MNTEQKQPTIEERIAARTDLAVAGETAISQAFGGLSFTDMGQVMEFAKLMAVSGQAVPKHLRGQPGACLAVSLQALNWRMDPFAVANKSYSVNDRIVYEAQLIQAVIEQRAPIKGRIKGRFEGEADTRVCILKVTSAEDGDEIEYRSPQIGKITTKNSPLWRGDPDQQLWYYSARAMCRRHFPDVLLGVYEKEEIETSTRVRDITPTERPRTKLQEKVMAAREQAQGTGEAETPEQEPGQTIDGEALPADDEIDPSEFEFAEGVTAANEGQTLDDCPYQDEGRQRSHWLAGFNRQSELLHEAQ